MDKVFIIIFKNLLFKKNNFKSKYFYYSSKIIDLKNKLKIDNNEDDLKLVFPKNIGEQYDKYSYIKIKIKNNYLKTKKMFFEYLYSMRLFNNNYFYVYSSFMINEQKKIKFSTIRHYYQKPVYRPNEMIDYVNIKKVDNIYQRMVEIKESNLKRFNNALNLFSHITMGWTESMQLNYLGLFACLESLYKISYSDKSHKNTLIQRIKIIFKNLLFKFDLDTWLETQYKKGRCELSHGDYNVPWIGNSKKKKNTFKNLHEIIRITILKYFSLDISKLKYQSGNRDDVIYYFSDEFEINKYLSDKYIYNLDNDIMIPFSSKIKGVTH